MRSLLSKLWYHLPKVALSILKIGSYQQTPNKIMRNEGEKKREIKSNINSKQKADDLACLFMFPGLNNKKK